MGLASDPLMAPGLRHHGGNGIAHGRPTGACPKEVIGCSKQGDKGRLLKRAQLHRYAKP